MIDLDMHPAAFARLLTAVIALSVAVHGQSPRNPVYRAETELVRITATVSDAQGKPVTDLRQDEFYVAEDGVQQEIALFAQDLATPVSVVVVLDTSGSMDHFDPVRRGLMDFFAAAGPDDEIALMTFNDKVHLVSPFGGDREAAIGAIAQMQAKGRTALYEAIVDALDVVAQGQHRKKVMMVVTDGNDTTERVSRQAAGKAFKRSEVLMYGLGIGHGGSDSLKNRFLAVVDNARMRTLRALARASGGRAELVANPNGKNGELVHQTIKAFGDELRQQYTLGYYPSARSVRKEAHTLSVIVRRAGHVVRARKVYQRPVTR
jgi:Ca-activated chloride channel family protein